MAQKKTDMLLQYLDPEIQNEEKRMEIYLLNLKYSCTCIVNEKAYGEEYIQSV